MELTIKQEWTADLRSDKYHKVVGVFADDCGGRCALGVLLEVLGKDPVKACSLDYGAERGDMITALYDAIEHAGVNPREIYSLNDTEGKSFAEIADYIDSKDFTAPIAE